MGCINTRVESPEDYTSPENVTSVHSAGPPAPAADSSKPSSATISPKASSPSTPVEKNSSVATKPSLAQKTPSKVPTDSKYSVKSASSPKTVPKHDCVHKKKAPAPVPVSVKEDTPTLVPQEMDCDAAQSVKASGSEATVQCGPRPLAHQPVNNERVAAEEDYGYMLRDMQKRSYRKGAVNYSESYIP